MTAGIGGRAAIVGIAQTAFSKASGRSELALAVEAVLAALDDAGLTPSDVDGLCTFSADHNPESEVFRAIGGDTLHFWARAHPGGGAACAPLQIASNAVLSGSARVVVCYRALNGYSQYRYGQGYGTPQWGEPAVTADGTMKTLHSVHGLVTAAAMLAIPMRRYMHDFGATSEDFAHVSVAARRHASTNPRAQFYGKPITIADHQHSRLVADPFRLLDCCQESDGGVALVVTTTDRARDLRQAPVRILAATQAIGRGQVPMTDYYRPDIADFAEVALVARRLYAETGLAPTDIQAAMLYDHFGPTLLPQLEACGFCARGEARHFVRDGGIEVGGRLPVNTHGGQLGEAYLHGMNGITEAVRQLRGTADNPVTGVRHVLVTGAPGTSTSGALLGRA